jgi:broad-specificity NMP kinase
MSKAQPQPGVYVVIITGLPGSGKSTFSTALEKFGSSFEEATVFPETFAKQ